MLVWYKTEMSGRISNFLWVIGFCAVLGAVGQASAQGKFQRYIRAVPADLFEMCVNRSDDIACYFYGGLQKKRGNMVNARDAFFLGAQLARQRAGFVCMLELARMYEKGEGVRADSIQAYRWYTVLMTDQPAQDLRAAASNKRQSLAAGMTADQIAKAQAMARAWKTQRGS